MAEENKYLNEAPTDLITISDLLLRLNAATERVWVKANDMGLWFPEGIYYIQGTNYYTSLDSAVLPKYKKDGENARETGTFFDTNGITTYPNAILGFDAAAAAICDINVKDYLGVVVNAITDETGTDVDLKEGFSTNAISINAGGIVRIPVGYNKIEYHIQASDLVGLTNGTAKSKHIYNGKTAWVNGSKITGTLDTVYLNPANPTKDSEEGNLTVGINPGWKNGNDGDELLLTNIPINPENLEEHPNKINSYKKDPEDSEDYLQVDVGIPAYYNGSLKTKTPYYSGNISEKLAITKREGPDNKSLYEIGAILLPSGYYANEIKVGGYLELPKDETDEGDWVLNYETLKLYEYANSGGDYDNDLNLIPTIINKYYSANPTDKDAFNNIIGNYNGQDYIIFKPRDNVDYFDKVHLPIASYTIRNNTSVVLEVRITKPGWINADTFGGLLTLKSLNTVYESIENEIATTSSTNIIKDSSFTISVDENTGTTTGLSIDYTVQLAKRVTTDGTSSNYFKYRKGWIDDNTWIAEIQKENLNEYNPLVNSTTILKGTIFTQDVQLPKIQTGIGEYMINDDDLADKDLYSNSVLPDDKKDSAANVRFKAIFADDDDNPVYVHEAIIDMSLILQKLQEI